jgi:hypothetical protein
MPKLEENSQLFVTLKTKETEITPLPSLWGETLNLRGLYPRKIVDLSESDGRTLLPSRSKNTHFFYVDAKRLAAGYHKGQSRALQGKKR